MHRTVDTWEANAKIDPLFAILTDDNKRASWSIDDFFASGEVEIGRVFAFMAEAGIEPNRSGRFMDFGCGVGRNTRALIKRFGSGVGVDASNTMITHARSYAEKDQARATYVVNTASDLNILPSASIDFVYSHIVLQHLPPALQGRYIAEFMRLLTPEGIAVFQIPTGWIARDVKTALRRLTPYWLKDAIHAITGQHIKMQMHILPCRAVSGICERSGRAIACAPFTNSTEQDCNGNVVFMDRSEAVQRIRNGTAKSHFLSQFFFVCRGVT
jgi:SAM-dependent methyltransferase